MYASVNNLFSTYKQWIMSPDSGRLVLLGGRLGESLTFASPDEVACCIASLE